MIRKLGANFQIAIPKEIVNALHLEKGNYIDVTIVDGGIYLKPHIIIPRDQLEKKITNNSPA